jgi:hypothetical protein
MEIEPITSEDYLYIYMVWINYSIWPIEKNCYVGAMGQMGTVHPYNATFFTFYSCVA